MDILKIFWYSFLSYGLTEALVYFSGPFGIFDKLRDLLARISDGLAELISCVFCTSTWMGLFLSAANMLLLPDCPFTPFNIIMEGTGLWWLILPFDMFSTAGVVWLLYTLERALEKDGGDE